MADQNLRRTRGVTDADRQDGYTEIWDYQQLPIDLIAQVLQAVEDRH